MGVTGIEPVTSRV